MLIYCERESKNDKIVKIENSKSTKVDFLSDNLGIIRKLSQKSRVSNLGIKGQYNRTYEIDDDYLLLYNNAVKYLVSQGDITEKELEAIFKGGKDLVKKTVVKFIAKRVASKLIPYVGGSQQ